MRMTIVTFMTTPHKKLVRDLVDCGALDDTGGGRSMGTFFSRNTGETLRTAGALSTVGLAFVLALVIGFWIGTVLDGWLGTKPAFTIVFFFFGLAAGALNVFRIVSQAFPKGAATPRDGPQPPASSLTDSGVVPDDELHDDEA
jgi:Putative F0F1-ATPase subunit Ca2+/Mg2+ transporter